MRARGLRPRGLSRLSNNLGNNKMRPAKRVILWVFAITMAIIMTTYVLSGFGLFDAQKASMLTLLITGTLGAFFGADQIKAAVGHWQSNKNNFNNGEGK